MLTISVSAHNFCDNNQVNQIWNRSKIPVNYLKFNNPTWENGSTKWPAALSVCVCVAAGNITATDAPVPTTTEWMMDYTDILSKFSLRTAELPDDDMCYMVAGRPETITECEFNAESQTFIVIHGWTVSNNKSTFLFAYKA